MSISFRFSTFEVRRWGVLEELFWLICFMFIFKMFNYDCMFLRFMIINLRLIRIMKNLLKFFNFLI